MTNQWQLEFRPFDECHLPEYRGWFSSPEIAAALGDLPDDEWFEFVRSDKSGLQFAVMQSDDLVAVVGLVLPNEGSPKCVITDIAVDPTQTRNGIGTAVLKGITEVSGYTTVYAFVEKQNPIAFEFFMKNGWTVITTPDEDSSGMFEFCSPPNDGMNVD